MLAQVEMRADAVDEYVEMQSRPFTWGLIERGPQAPSLVLGQRQFASVLDSLRRRGWHLDPEGTVLCAQANTAPTAGYLCWIIVQAGREETARVYVYWEQLW
jgi:hypothetical protein